MAWPNCWRSLRVVEGEVERALGDADGLGGDGDPGVVEGLHRGLEAGALLADHPVGGDPHVVEVDLARRAALDAELLLLGAERDALVALLDHERRDAAAALVGVGHRHHGVELADAGVGDPALDAVEHPLVAVAHRAGLHGDRVGAGLGLGQAVGEAAVARREPAQVVLLQLLRAGDHHRQRAELVDRGDQAAAHADPGDLLDHQHRGQRVGAGAAVLLGHVGRVEVGLLEGLRGLLGVAALLVDLGGVRRDLGRTQVADGLPDRLVLLREGEQGEVVAHVRILLPGNRALRGGGGRRS